MLKLLKSYKFWTALAGAVGALFVALSDTFGVNINAQGAKEIIMSICGILIVFGIVTKPKTKQENLQKDNKKAQNNDAGK